MSLYVGTIGESVWRSDDDGESFRRVSNGMFSECDVRALVVAPDPTVVYAGTEAGLYRSQDRGDHWTHLRSPMDGAQIWSLAIHPRRPEVLFAGACPGAVYRSLDAGESWTEMAADIRRDCPGIIHTRVTTLLVDPRDGETVWAGVEIDGVRRGRSLGKEWDSPNSGLTNADIHGLAAIPGQEPLMLASTNSDLFRSRDGGASWEPLNVKASFPWAYCRALAQKADDPRTLFAGIGNGPPGDVGGIQRSTDGGETWAAALLPADTPNSTIWNIATHASDPRCVYATSVCGHLFQSTDGGGTFRKLKREFGEVRGLAWARE